MQKEALGALPAPRRWLQVALVPFRAFRVPAFCRVKSRCSWDSARGTRVARMSHTHIFSYYQSYAYAFMAIINICLGVSLISPIASHAGHSRTGYCESDIRTRGGRVTPRPSGRDLGSSLQGRYTAWGKRDSTRSVT